MRVAMLGLSIMLTGIMLQLPADGQIDMTAYLFFVCGQVMLLSGLWQDWKKEKAK